MSNVIRLGGPDPLVSSSRSAGERRDGAPAQTATVASFEDSLLAQVRSGTGASGAGGAAHQAVRTGARPIMPAGFSKKDLAETDPVPSTDAQQPAQSPATVPGVPALSVPPAVAGPNSTTMPVLLEATGVAVDSMTSSSGVAVVASSLLSGVTSVGAQPMAAVTVVPTAATVDSVAGLSTLPEASQDVPGAPVGGANSASAGLTLTTAGVPVEDGRASLTAAPVTGPGEPDASVVAVAAAVPGRPSPQTVAGPGGVVRDLGPQSLASVQRTAVVPGAAGLAAHATPGSAAALAEAVPPALTSPVALTQTSTQTSTSATTPSGHVPVAVSGVGAITGPVATQPLGLVSGSVATSDPVVVVATSPMTSPMTSPITSLVTDPATSPASNAVTVPVTSPVAGPALSPVVGLSAGSTRIGVGASVSVSGSITDAGDTVVGLGPVPAETVNVAAPAEVPADPTAVDTAASEPITPDAGAEPVPSDEAGLSPEDDGTGAEPDPTGTGSARTSAPQDPATGDVAPDLTVPDPAAGRVPGRSTGPDALGSIPVPVHRPGDAPQTDSDPTALPTTGVAATTASGLDSAPVAAPVLAAASVTSAVEPVATAVADAARPNLPVGNESVAAVAAPAPQVSTPATVGRPAAPVPHQAPPLPHEQVAVAVQPMLRGDDGTHRLHLQLNPEHLGKVAISLELRRGEVAVTMHAADAAARDLLRDNLDGLRSQLQQLGLKAGHLDVGTGQHNSNQFGESGRTGDGSERRRSSAQNQSGLPQAADEAMTSEVADDDGALDLRL